MIKIKKKPCLKCGKTKILDSFTTDKSTVSRRARICKTCNYKSREKEKRTPEEIERIKKIMARPVNIKSTHAYWMLMNSDKYKAKELELK
ncbi:MAG: hypothetical protein V3U78_05505 [Thiotrichaceae bacterium]